MAHKKTKHFKLSHIAKDVILAVLALVSVTLLGLEYFQKLSAEEIELAYIVDISISFVFLIEFVLSLLAARSKRDFLKKRWWESLACIPISSSATQALRAIPLWRVLRVSESLRLARFGIHATTVKKDL